MPIQYRTSSRLTNPPSKIEFLFEHIYSFSKSWLYTCYLCNPHTNNLVKIYFINKDLCAVTITSTRTDTRTLIIRTYIMTGYSISRTLLVKLPISVCRHLPRHSCIVLTQQTQSQLVVYTVIIAEQTVITVSENECIYHCDQELDKTGTLKLSVTIICDIMLAPMASEQFPSSQIPSHGLGEPVTNGFQTRANGAAK